MLAADRKRLKEVLADYGIKRLTFGDRNQPYLGSFLFATVPSDKYKGESSVKYLCINEGEQMYVEVVFFEESIRQEAESKIRLANGATYRFEDIRNQQQQSLSPDFAESRKELVKILNDRELLDQELFAIDELVSMESYTSEFA